jgi:hypothetical protein
MRDSARLCLSLKWHGSKAKGAIRQASVVAAAIPFLAKAITPTLIKGIAVARATLVPIGLGVAAYRLRPLGTSGAAEDLKDTISLAPPTCNIDSMGYLTKEEAEDMFIQAGAAPLFAELAAERCTTHVNAGHKVLKCAHNAP